MKLKELLNKKINIRNKQISLDVRKLKLQECKLDIDDILEIELNGFKKNKKWD